MTVIDTPPSGADATRPARSPRIVAAAGTAVVLAGAVLLVLGFRDWGAPRYGQFPATHPTGRLAAGLAVAAVGLALSLRAGARGRFRRGYTLAAIVAVVLAAGIAGWLAAGLTPFAWPTRAGVGAVVGAALVAWGVLVATAGRLVAERPAGASWAGPVVAAVAAVVAVAACVPLVGFDVSPRVQVATGASGYRPPDRLPTTPSWTTTDRVLGSSATTVVLAHDADDRCIVRGVDAGSGDARWEWSAPTGGCATAPADPVLARVGVVAIPAVDREFLLDAETGRELWEHRVDFERPTSPNPALSQSTVAASTSTVLTRAVTADGLRFAVVDLRSGRVVQNVESSRFCSDLDDLGVTDGRVAVAGSTAAFLVTCEAGDTHLVFAPATGTVSSSDVDGPAGLTTAQDTFVVADRPSDTSVQVRGFGADSSAPRWTTTYPTTTRREAVNGYVAALTGGAVVVAIGRSGTTGVVQVDAATGTVSGFEGPVPDRTSLPLGCTDATCWYPSDDGGSLVGLDDGQLPRSGDPLFGPSVIVDVTDGGASVYG